MCKLIIKLFKIFHVLSVGVVHLEIADWGITDINCLRQKKQTLEETAQLLGKLRLFTAYSGTADNASNCSTSKKISGRITDAISRVQTAGLAFGGTSVCSYRVRGVDGRCADHLTVESYTVLLVFHHPLTLSFQA